MAVTLRRICCAATALITLTCALPAQPQLGPDFRMLYDRSLAALGKRQNPATGLPDGIGDVDILQFALTLEHLESAFYQQGFAQFQDADFTALGLNAAQLADLKSIQDSEQAHVVALNSAIAATGTAPVQACTYNFGFTTAAAMVTTASVLENIGVSAYLGAAPLITSAGILGVAASIATVESRHQTFIRTASQAVAIPSPFDAPLGVRSVFSLAAPFISSCPSGSNLAITPFPALTQVSPAAGTAIVAGTSLVLGLDATASAAGTPAFCAFTNGGSPGGSVFVPVSPASDGASGAAGQTSCVVPQNLRGVVYVSMASADPGTGVLTDAITVAGPVVIVVS